MHPLRYAPAPPRRVAVHTPDAVAWHPCTVAPRAAHGLALDALVAARRLPPCEVRA